MDQEINLKVQNILNEMTNQMLKDHIDTFTSKALFAVAINRINLLLTHIGYLEEKLESTVESNKLLSIHADNIIAENQRLTQNVKY